MDNKYIELVNNIYNNIDNFLDNELLKMYIKNSENIIEKYIQLYPDLTYHQVLSIYLGVTFYIYNNI